MLFSKKMQFGVVIHTGMVKPWPFLLWMALSMWGDEFVAPNAGTPNNIVIANGSFFGKTERVYGTTGSLCNTTIFLNTQQMQTNGVFFNVLLHELGHVHGFSHNTTDSYTCIGKIMTFQVLVFPNGTPVPSMFLCDSKRFVPFSPVASLNYTGNFYDLL